jgi:hypothetical protein
MLAWGFRALATLLLGISTWVGSMIVENQGKQSDQISALTVGIAVLTQAVNGDKATIDTSLAAMDRVVLDHEARLRSVERPITR